MGKSFFFLHECPQKSIGSFLPVFCGSFHPSKTEGKVVLQPGNLGSYHLLLCTITQRLWGKEKVFIIKVPNLRGLGESLLQANLFFKAQKSSLSNLRKTEIPIQTHAQNFPSILYLSFSELDIST